ncbi:MAG: sigma-70 family RNA polymerase sigma factor [Acidimicrobiales bacterium]
MTILGHPAVVRASDTDLQRGLCVHDLAALEEVVRRYASRVANLARQIGGECRVDDVVQEVFLSLWRAPERFQPERGNLVTYLMTLTRGKTLDALRSDGAWQRRHRNQAIQKGRGDEVEAAVMAGATATEVRAALRALPMTERVAIELAFFGGDSYRQVAVKLALPEGTVKSRIRSGLRRLEAILQGMGTSGVE